MKKKNKTETYYIAKHDDFVLGRYNFNLDTSKLLNVIAYKAQAPFTKGLEVKRGDELKGYEYTFNFEELKKEANVYNRLESNESNWKTILKDLTSKIIIFDDEKQTKGVGIFKEFKIDKTTNKLTVEIDVDVKKFIFDKIAYKKLNKLSTEYMYYCTSKYSFRLYEILLNRIKNIKDKDKKFNIILDLKELREVLCIPKSYKFGMINERILKKAEIDFNALHYKKDKDKQDKYRLFKSFSYKEIEAITHKRGQKPVESIRFTFELLQSTIFLMMSENQKIKSKENKEDYLYNSVEVAFMDNSKNKKFMNNRTVSEVFEDVVQAITDVQGEYELPQIKHSIQIKSVEFCFRKLEKWEGFIYFFKKILRSNIDYDKKPSYRQKTFYDKNN